MGKQRAEIEAKYPVGTLEYKYSGVFDQFATVCVGGAGCCETTGLTQEAFMKAIGRKPNDQMGPKLYRALDVTNTGVVERDDFVSQMAVLCNGTSRDVQTVAHRIWDTDGDGLVSLQECVDFYKTKMGDTYNEEYECLMEDIFDEVGCLDE